MSNRLLLNQIMRSQTREFLPTRHSRADNLLSWRGIHAAWRRYCSRQHIAELDGHLLKDIGVSFAEAEAEANKPFWRV
jgi:uncharacterized protein YjiS (DUF1127 family)